MKKLFTLIQISAFIITVFFISSCHVSKVNDFTAQKYTHFKRGKAEVSFKENAKENILNGVYSMPLKSSESLELASINTPVLQYLNKTAPQKNEELSGNMVSENKKETKNSKKFLKRRTLLPFVINRFIDKPNTASAHNSSDVELLLLVILALILPPIAVLLARGAGSEFLLSIILTILFWVPGQIYALLVVFDVI